MQKYKGAAKHLQLGEGDTIRRPPKLLKDPNSNFPLGFRTLHFENMIKRFFFVKFCKKCKS